MLYRNLIFVLLGLIIISCSGTVPSVGNEVSVQEVEKVMKSQLNKKSLLKHLLCKSQNHPHCL